MGHFHLVGRKTYQRRRKKVATQRVRMSAQQQLCTIIDGVLHILTDFFNRISINERTDINIRLGAIADMQLAVHGNR